MKKKSKRWLIISSSLKLSRVPQSRTAREINGLRVGVACPFFFALNMRTSANRSGIIKAV
jgi:hypothetical protein